MSQPAPVDQQQANQQLSQQQTQAPQQQQVPQQPVPVPYVQNLGGYNLLINQLGPAPPLLVLDFTATWCGPCRCISPHFQQMSQDYPDVCFRKVDVDDCPDVSEFFRVEAMPTFVFLRGGNVLTRFAGADHRKLRELVEKFRFVPPPNQA